MPTTPRQRSSYRFLPVLLAAVLCQWLVGCGAYQLQGKVIQGPSPAVLVVSENDPRLDGMPIEGATVEATLDPSTLSPQQLGSVTTDRRGQFQMPIDEAGVGLLEYELGLLVRASEHRPLWQSLDMPPNNRRLLIIMTPGRDEYEPEVDIIEETLRLGGETSSVR